MRLNRNKFLFCAAAMAMLIVISMNVLRAKAQGMREISARSAVVYCPSTGDVLFTKNASERRPMASTTKIMSALIALEQPDLDAEFVVDSDAIRIEGSSMGLREGDLVSLRDLVCGMLLPSGNDAANAAAVHISGSVDAFVELMNEKARELGLEDTHFVTPSGLDDYTDDHYSTALDMARLTAYAMENQDFRDICSQPQMKLTFGDPPFDRWLRNTNKLLGYSSDIVGVKTGFTDKAGRCLVSACDRNGTELICVTLNAPDDWNDHMYLYETCFDYVSEQRLSPESDTLTVGLVGSDRDTLRCQVPSASAVLLNGRGEKVTSQVYIQPFVYAPVRAGDKVGCVQYRYNGRLIAQCDITAAEDARYISGEKKNTGLLAWFRKQLHSLIA